MDELIGVISGGGSLVGAVTAPEKVTVQANKNVAPSTSQQVVEPDTGYTAMAQVTVGAVSLQDKSVTPSSSQQTVTADQGYNGLGTVTVGAAPAGNDTLPTAVFDGIQSRTLYAPGSDKIFKGLNIADVVLPDATKINNGAFQGNKALQTLSAPVCTEIGGQAFSYSELQTVNLPEVTTVKSSAFTSCKLTTLTLPKVTFIDMSAFSSISTLMSISLPLWPGSANYSGPTSGLSSCTSLTSVDLPEATALPASFLMGCSSLASITLPKCTSIGASVFTSCTNLLDLYLPGNTVCALASTNALLTSGIGTNENGRIHVPAELVDTYKGETNWSSFASKIVAIAE